MLFWKGRKATLKTWCRGEPPSGSLAKTTISRALVGGMRRFAGFATALLPWLLLADVAVDFVNRLFSVLPIIEGWRTDVA